MLQQDRHVNPIFGGAGGGSSSLRLLSNSQQQCNRKCEKDGNFNFLGQDDDSLTGDENRNQVHPRALGPLGRDPPPPATHYGPASMSPFSRLPCWSPLEPLPEIESGDDVCGRVPPDGAEEGKMDEEMRRLSDEEKESEPEEGGKGQFEEEEKNELEWGDSDSEFEFSDRSDGSPDSLSLESGEVAGVGTLNSIWDRICVGGLTAEGGDGTPEALGSRSREADNKAERCRKSLGVSGLVDDGSSDSDTELPELMEAVWTLRDRERFKAQEMEKHQVQLTMYRRLALIRWVRTLQGRIQEQQNRLQSSFDIILTQRKELLRMGVPTASQ